MSTRSNDQRFDSLRQVFTVGELAKAFETWGIPAFNIASHLEAQGLIEYVGNFHYRKKPRATNEQPL